MVGASHLQDLDIFPTRHDLVGEQEKDDAIYGIGYLRGIELVGLDLSSDHSHSVPVLETVRKVEQELTIVAAHHVPYHGQGIDDDAGGHYLGDLLIDDVQYF